MNALALYHDDVGARRAKRRARRRAARGARANAFASHVGDHRLVIRQEGGDMVAHLAVSVRGGQVMQFTARVPIAAVRAALMRRMGVSGEGDVGFFGGIKKLAKKAKKLGGKLVGSKVWKLAEKVVGHPALVPILGPAGIATAQSMKMTRGLAKSAGLLKKGGKRNTRKARRIVRAVAKAAKSQPLTAAHAAARAPQLYLTLSPA